jgi:hypothetical protein
MAGNTCGYQLILLDGATGEPLFDMDGQPIATGSIITLGVPRWGRTKQKLREDLVLTTEKGYEWIYPQWDRRHYVLTFRILPNKLASSIEIFRTLDEAVSGHRDPFLFYENILGSPSSAVLVRKTKDFDEGAEQPITYTTGVVRSVDYVLELFEVVTGTDIL